MLLTIISYVAVALAGIIAGLKVIAPLTASKLDDEALEYAEKVEPILDSVVKK